ADRTHRGIDVNAPTSPRGSADEERDGSVVVQWRHRELVLGRESKRRAGCGQHHSSTGQHWRNDRGDTWKLLEVVEDDEHSTAGEPAHDVVVRLEPDSLGNGGPNAGGLPKRGKRHEEHAVRELLNELGRRLDREAGLARAAGTCEGHEARAAA